MEVLPTHNYQPDIALWGFRIGEPVIVLTGLLIAIVCMYAWYRLGRHPLQDDVTRLSRYFFLLTGISTVIGAIVGHAFLHALPFAWKLPGWMTGMVAVSALEQATIVRARDLLRPLWIKGLTWFNILTLTLAFWFVSSTLWFPGVEIHSALGFLLVIGPLEGLRWFRTKARSSQWIWYGIAALFAAVVSHLTKWSPDPWFCYFDVAHLWMCVAIGCFMYGAEIGAAERFTIVNGASQV